MNKPNTLKLLFALGMFLALSHGFTHAQELSYDRYAPVYDQVKGRSALGSVANDFLTYPFELIRWPTNKALVFAEEQNLPTKAHWLYDTSVDHGFTPYLGFRRYGGEVDLIRATRQKVRFPDYTLKGWVDKNETRFFTGGKIGAESILGSPFRTFGLVQYEHRPEEHFYGIGPDTSRGEGTSYKQEQTTLEAAVGYSADPSFSADLKFSYRNINIGDGHDGGRGVIDRTFPNQTIPGLDGDEIVAAGLELVRDTRNHKEMSTRGYYARLGSSINEGLFNSEARYLKNILEFSKYQKLGSDRRIFVFHTYVENNNPFEDRRVPFHDMAKLGGYGNHPSLSHTFRGFNENRFFDQNAVVFNFEYRYTIYEYRDWKTDAVFFWDEGQVFKKLSKMQIQDFEGTYGMGFRVSLLNHVLLSIEMAHGNEGTDFYVKNRSPF